MLIALIILVLILHIRVKIYLDRRFNELESDIHYDMEDIIDAILELKNDKGENIPGPDNK